MYDIMYMYNVHVHPRYIHVCTTCCFQITDRKGVASLVAYLKCDVQELVKEVRMEPLPSLSGRLYSYLYIKLHMCNVYMYMYMYICAVYI